MRLTVETRLREALRAAVLATGRVSDLDLSEVRLEKPREPGHGDLASSVAMVLASRTKGPPRALAESIAGHLETPEDWIERVEVAGPGFLNLHWSEAFLRSETERIGRDGEQYGREGGGAGERVQVEFVSANPTGPLNVVSARAAAVGDALARILEWAGWEVEKEFYVNDGGTQVDLFGRSIRARFLEMAGLDAVFPEEGYRGLWVGEVAESIWRLLGAVADTASGRASLDEWARALDVESLRTSWNGLDGPGRASRLGVALIAAAGDRRGALRLAAAWPEAARARTLEGPPFSPDAALRQAGVPWGDAFPFGPVGVALMVESQRTSLRDFGVEYDSEAGGSGEARGWFHESVLYERGSVGATLERLRTLDATYERDGATWLATTRAGDEEDRVLVRGDGRPTYFLTDIAYHCDKQRRAYGRVIDIWGPDHHGHVARMKAAMQLLGAKPGWLEVIIAQQVNVLKDGKPVKMSKRGGELITLDEVAEEAGRDTSRFFFLMRRTSAHLDFDLDLARKTSDENPVYYVQYALARIASIREFALGRGLAPGGSGALGGLGAPRELDLMRDLVRFPAEMRGAAQALEPHRITVYLQELAQSFHKFYQEVRVVTDDEPSSLARLTLVEAVRVILETGLRRIGVRPPSERM